jgi:high-affinity nickel-transport protein
VTLQTLSSLALVFALGLRHGLDPDHISAIDGMTFRSAGRGSRLAPWIGSLFAAGHGGVVTLVGVLVSVYSRRLPIPDAWIGQAERLPIVLLLVVGFLNWRELRRPGPFRLTGWKARWLPGWLREGSGPVSVVLVGILFALAFDTVTQATAWGMAAATGGGILAALVVGVVFTLGMATTDSIDSRLVAGLLATRHAEARERLQRAVGSFVVALSFGVAFYELLVWWRPAWEPSGPVMTVGGALCVAAMGVVALKQQFLAPHADALQQTDRR